MARPLQQHESVLRIRHLELRDLSPLQLGLLVKLASLAAISPVSGYVCDEKGIQYTIEQLEIVLNVRHSILSKQLEALQKADHIVFTKDGISISEWAKWYDNKLVQHREYMRKRRNL